MLYQKLKLLNCLTNSLESWCTSELLGRYNNKGYDYSLDYFQEGNNNS